jgi:hypothetical protein
MQCIILSLWGEIKKIIPGPASPDTEAIIVVYNELTLKRAYIEEA